MFADDAEVGCDLGGGAARRRDRARRRCRERGGAGAGAADVSILTFPSALKIYLAVEPVDIRKQFNGLWALAEQKLSEDPRRGEVFAFTNKDRNRLKMLYWDGT